MVAEIHNNTISPFLPFHSIKFTKSVYKNECVYKITYMNSTYLRFLALVHTIDGTSTQLANVDETAKHLLNVIALNHSNGKPLTVTEAMALKSIASPATIHRKLNDLLEVGLVEQVFEGKNRRTKYLVTTKNAEKYFSSLSECMKQALLSD